MYAKGVPASDQADAALHEAVEGLAAKESVLQQRKVDELAYHLWLGVLDALLDERMVWT